MNCRELDLELDDYVADRCEAQARRAVTEHLASCVACRALHGTLQTLRTRLKAAAARPSSPLPSPTSSEPTLAADFADRVMALVHQQAEVAEAGRSRFRLSRLPLRRVTLWGSLAAAAVLSFAVLLAWWRGGHEPNPELRPQPVPTVVASSTLPAKTLTAPILTPNSAAATAAISQATNPQCVGRAADRLGHQLLSTLEVVTPSVPPVSTVATELPGEIADYGFSSFNGYGFPSGTSSPSSSIDTPAGVPTPPLELVGQRGSEMVRAGVGVARKPAESLLSFVVRQGRSFRPIDKSDKPRGS